MKRDRSGRGHENAKNADSSIIIIIIIIVIVIVRIRKRFQSSKKWSIMYRKKEEKNKAVREIVMNDWFQELGV